MQLTITISDPKHAVGLQRAVAAYNAAHGSALDEAGFAQLLLVNECASFAQRYLVTVVSRLSFLQRFTSEERVAIRTAAQQSPAVQDYLELLNVSEQVDLTHALTVEGVQQLEAAGLLAAGRASEILAL